MVANYDDKPFGLNWGIKPGYRWGCAQLALTSSWRRHRSRHASDVEAVQEGAREHGLGLSIELAEACKDVASCVNAHLQAHVLHISKHTLQSRGIWEKCGTQTLKVKNGWK